MQALRALIRAERDDIVNDVTQRLRAERLLPSSMPHPDVVDSLPHFLDRLGDAAEHATELDDVEAVAKAHAVQRLRLGFGIRDVVREHAILMDAILERALARNLDARSVAALARLNVQAIAAAVDEYGAARERESREQTQKHFGFIAHELRNPLTSVRLALSGCDARHRA